MTDDDIHAFRPAAAPAAVAPVLPRARRRWPWVLLGGATLVALLLAAVAALGAMALTDWAGPGVTLIVDDEQLNLQHLDVADAFGALLGLGIAFVVVLVVVPLALLAAFAAVGLALGIVLLVLLAVGAVAFSPLIVLLVLLWWGWRALRRRPATVG